VPAATLTPRHHADGTGCRIGVSSHQGHQVRPSSTTSAC